MAAAAGALILAGVLAFEVATWDKITPGVTALGTPVGGMSQADASAKLTPNTESLLGRPLQIRYADRTWNTTARDLGMRLPAAELAQAAYQIGREGNPIGRLGEQIGALVGGKSVSASGNTDQAALDASLARIAREVDRSPQDARLTLNTRDGTMQHQPAQIGLGVDIPASRDRIAAALSTSAQTVDLVVRETPPAVGNEQVQAARDQLEHLLGGNGEPPLTLTFGKQKWPIERAEVLRLISLEPPVRAGQPFTVKLDEAPLTALAARLAKDVNQDVLDARFQFTNGALRVTRESKDGQVLDQKATVGLIKSKLLAGERTAELPVEVTKATVSSDDPKSLGIVELIDRGSTSFAGSIPEKQHNIRLAAERLNGVVVPPGGMFSFNKEVGPTTLDAGFKWGFGITTGENGGAKTVPSVAGGICQVATTLFQPVFWAGFPLEERYSHLYWIPAYTSRGVVGLDVTVDSDSNLDFKWVNPTDSYVLVQSASDEGNVYFALYGKKPTWKVQVEDAKITNRTPADPKPIAEAEPSLAWGRTLQVETAREGFDVVVSRTVLTNAGEPRTLNLKTTYQPSRTVTLVGTANKPADARVEDAIAKIVGPADKPETKETPTAGATPVGSNAPAAPTPKPTTEAANPTPAPKPDQSQPQPKPTTAPAQPKPNSNSAPGPTPTRTP